MRKQGHGVRFNGNCKGIVFDQNEIAHNAGVGVQVTGDNVSQLSFYGNSVLDNDGSTLDSDQVPHVTWSGNHVVPAGSAKLWEDASENVSLISGTLQFNTTSVAVGTPIEASSQFQNGFTPVAWLWDLGDGPPVISSTTRHVYDQSGNYRVTLLSWDAAGRVGRAIGTVIVSQSAAAANRN